MVSPHAFHSSYKSQAVLPGELLLHHVSVPKPPIANSEGEFVIKKVVWLLADFLPT